MYPNHGRGPQQLALPVGPGNPSSIDISPGQGSPGRVPSTSEKWRGSITLISIVAPESRARMRREGVRVVRHDARQVCGLQHQSGMATELSTTQLAWPTRHDAALSTPESDLEKCEGSWSGVAVGRVDDVLGVGIVTYRASVLLEAVEIAVAHAVA